LYQGWPRVLLVNPVSNLLLPRVDTAISLSKLDALNKPARFKIYKKHYSNLQFIKLILEKSYFISHRCGGLFMA